MCGRSLPEPTAEMPAAEPVAKEEPPPRRAPEPTSPAPAYTGGIFNLGAPAESSRNLDYLLEDEEPKSRKGWFLLALVALALVAGLGWLRWRREGLPFSGSFSAARTNTTTAPPTADSSAIASAPQSSAPAPATSEANPSSTAVAETQPPAATPAPGPAPSGTSPATPAPASSTTGEQPAQKPPSDSESGKAATVITALADTKPAEASPKAAEAAPPPASEAKPAAHKPAPPPVPPKPAPKPADPIVLGEQYLYGRNGIPQNCERGLRYIKAAADQSNPKAMITMGALYATGHCLSRDLPTAYRYFALALRVDPENGPLRQNVDMVWKQMTAEERKQAIRLTQ